MEKIQKTTKLDNKKLNTEKFEKSKDENEKIV